MPYQYLYTPLEGATLVERRHPRDVELPNMTQVDNMILSRSDKTLTLRPDWSPLADEIYSDAINFDTQDLAYSDYLNSVSGLYGTNSLVYFTAFFPIDNSLDIDDDDYSGIENTTIVSNTVEAGTTKASVTSGSSKVTTNAVTPNLNTKAYRGAMIRFDDDTTNGRFWVVDKVVGKQELILESAIDFTDASTNFDIIQTHGSHNADYKFHVEQFLANLLYNTPSISDDIPSTNITGPWAANITEEVITNVYSATEEEFTTDVYTSTNPGERMSRKGCASGATLFVMAHSWHSTDGLAPYGFHYSSAPWLGVASFENATFDAALSATQTHVDVMEIQDSYMYDQVVYDSGNSCFWIPAMIRDTSLSPGNEYALALMKLTDETTPTVTIHLTDHTYATEDEAQLFNYQYPMCVNTTDNTIWYPCGEFPDAASATKFTEEDNVLIISLTDFTTTTTTMPGEIEIWGIEYAATPDTTLVTGITVAGAPKAYKYSGSWATLTNPAGTGFTFYGCGVYDDGTNWLFVIAGMGDCFYWGKNDGTTIKNIGVGWDGTVEGGGYRCVSNAYYYDAESEYDTVLFASGHTHVAQLTVDPATSSIKSRGVIDFNSSSQYIQKVYADPSSTTDNKKYAAAAIGSKDSVAPPPDDFVHTIVIINQDIERDTIFYCGSFTPISDLYRARAFGVINGYVVLFGVSTYDSDADTWEYEPRMSVWTAPATVTDFSGTGSGTAEWKGNGEFLDARSVNGVIVTFESNCIGVLTPHGIVDDPWDYDVIYEGIRIISNPCQVNEQIYFVASDGLLWTTNGSAVEESGSSFDITQFNDFNEDKPVWLIYNEKTNSLMAFYPTGTNDVVYSICLSNGGVNKIDLVHLTDDSAEDPKSIVAIENSSDKQLIVSHRPLSTSTAIIVNGELDFGSKVSGIDTVTTGEDNYWYGQFTTGNVFPTPEGGKIGLKHIILNTYTDNPDTVTDNPDVIVEIKSLEDTTWHSANDSNLSGHITVDTSQCVISGAYGLFSNKLGAPGSLIVTSYNLPWIAANCRIYTETGGTYTECSAVGAAPTEVNTYYISGTQQIQVLSTAGHGVYCYCDNAPFITAKVGDYVLTDEGYHRITSFTNGYYAVLDRYKASGEDTDATHLTAEQMPVGTGVVKIGIDKAAEGAQLRITVLPRHGTGVTDQPTVAKITGLTLGFTPVALKTLEATGG